MISLNMAIDEINKNYCHKLYLNVCVGVPMAHGPKTQMILSARA